MKKLITINRQFSSGGREVGKRLAEALHFSYFDKELSNKIAQDTGFDPNYINHYSELAFSSAYAYTVGRSFFSYTSSPTDEIQILQNKVLRDLAEQENAVIIGRCADYVLDDKKPFKVFVYASDMDFRVQRCYEKNAEDASKSAKEMEKQILRIDKERAKYYEYYTGQKWKDLSNYNLCIDTSVVGVKKAVDILLAALSDA